MCGGAKNLARLAAGSVLRATVDGIRDATSQCPLHAHRIAMIGLKIAPDLTGGWGYRGRGLLGEERFSVPPSNFLDTAKKRAPDASGCNASLGTSRDSSVLLTRPYAPLGDAHLLT